MYLQVFQKFFPSLIVPSHFTNWSDCFLKECWKTKGSKFKIAFLQASSIVFWLIFWFPHHPCHLFQLFPIENCRFFLQVTYSRIWGKCLAKLVACLFEILSIFHTFGFMRCLFHLVASSLELQEGKNILFLKSSARISSEKSAMDRGLKVKEQDRSATPPGVVSI